MRIIILLFFLVFGLCETAKAQKIDLNDYENKAQAYAILSAQHSKDAYFYSRRNYFLRNPREIKQNCDTSIISAQIAIEYADSAFNAASDTSEYAKTIMLYAKNYQKLAIKKFNQIRSTNNPDLIHELSGKSMYAMGNAIADAYKASLAFDWKPEADSSLKSAGAMFDDNNGVQPLKVDTNYRETTRLESDEFSYMTIKELYGKRLAEIDDEINSLEAEAKNSKGDRLVEINKAIENLKWEEKKFFQKMRNSEDRLINVRNDLSEEMLKIVNKDIFTTEKEGFYNTNVPIPVDIDMPEGLVYKVQLGFFKSQLSPEHYSGIFPLASQKVDDTYYRYVAGNFSKYEDVKAARIAISKKGYTDSFVVAYVDGKKVPISEALKREKEDSEGD